MNRLRHATTNLEHTNLLTENGKKRKCCSTTLNNAVEWNGILVLVQAQRNVCAYPTVLDDFPELVILPII